MRTLFTVVVIACEVEKYLPECLDSILGQSFDDFDVLIGVEESKDKTYEIAQSYAKKYDKISEVKLLKKSGSASQIRNYGIDHAKGQYLLFIDGDDWIEKDSLTKFADKIKKFNLLDIIYSGANIYTEKGDVVSKTGQIFKGSYDDCIYSGCQYLLKVCTINKMRTATWMSLYRADFLRENKLYQEYSRRHQDDEWTPRVFLAAQKVASLKYAYYNYRKRAGSVTTKPNEKSMYDITLNLNSFFDCWHSGKIPEYLKSSFATWYLDYTCKFFTKKNSIIYPAKLREKCFMQALGNKLRYGDFNNMVKYSSFSKKMLWPIYSIARIPKMFSISQFLFAWVYEPIVFSLWPKISNKLKVFNK